VRQLGVVPLSFLFFVPCAFAGVAEERDGIVAAHALGPGLTVAHVGAGDGRYSVGLAGAVGPQGRVYATEVDRAEIDRITARAREEGLGNLTTVLGGQRETGLPEGCCDAILLRLVYHHFTDTAAMRRSLWSALRAGGRIAIIDVPPQKGWRRLDGVPERGGHGIEVAELVREMTASGFEVLARDEDWPAEDDAYLVVFRRPHGR
jgi:ubiquinone/menaquinone biosynthesis C-methylase UbiE